MISPVGNKAGRQRGYTYILVVATVAIIAILAEAASVSNQYRLQRDREAELLFRGMAYQRAIRSYVEADPQFRAYPQNLENLLRDPRFVHRQHIRKLYTDPMSDNDWQLIRGIDGGISGVASSSTATPLKQTGFPPGLENLQGAQSYSEWQFEYQLPPRPAAMPGASGEVRGPSGQAGVIR